MEISGKIIQINPEQSGQGRNGTWRKQEIILETQEQYPKKVCVAIWGDKIDQFGLNQGEVVTFGINVESREFNSKWYTDVKAWKVSKGAGSGSDSAEPDHVAANIPPPPMSSEPPVDTTQGVDEDDLPF